MVDIGSDLAELITETIATFLGAIFTSLLQTIGAVIFNIIGKFLGNEFTNSAVILLLTLIFVGTGAMVVKRAMA